MAVGNLADGQFWQAEAAVAAGSSMNAAGDERQGGLRLSKAPTRNNFVAKKNKKKKKNHLEIVFGTTLRRSANFYAKIDKVENYLETEYKFFKKSLTCS